MRVSYFISFDPLKDYNIVSVREKLAIKKSQIKTLQRCERYIAQILH